MQKKAACCRQQLRGNWAQNNVAGVLCYAYHLANPLCQPFLLVLLPFSMQKMLPTNRGGLAWAFLLDTSSCLLLLHSCRACSMLSTPLAARLATTIVLAQPLLS